MNELNQDEINEIATFPGKPEGKPEEKQEEKVRYEIKKSAYLAPAKEQSMLLDPVKFSHSQRVANMLAQSTMVPDHFRNNIGNCVIALNLADRMQLDPFMVMQKLYVIHGKPGIESQLAIAVINNSNKFTPLQYKLSDDKQSCYAYATNKATGELCKGPVVSIQMAKDEGWYNKNGSKWKTMPDLMLHYRSAIFFGRVFCPEALLGMEMKDEINDYKPARPVSANIVQVSHEDFEPEPEKPPKPEPKKKPEKKKATEKKPEKKIEYPEDLETAILLAYDQGKLTDAMMDMNITSIPGEKWKQQELWRRYKGLK